MKMIIAKENYTTGRKEDGKVERKIRNEDSRKLRDWMKTTR